MHLSVRMWHIPVVVYRNPSFPANKTEVLNHPTDTLPTQQLDSSFSWAKNHQTIDHHQFHLLMIHPNWHCLMDLLRNFLHLCNLWSKKQWTKNPQNIFGNWEIISNQIEYFVNSQIINLFSIFLLVVIKHSYININFPVASSRK